MYWLNWFIWFHFKCHLVAGNSFYVHVVSWTLSFCTHAENVLYSLITCISLHSKYLFVASWEFENFIDIHLVLKLSWDLLHFWVKDSSVLSSSKCISFWVSFCCHCHLVFNVSQVYVVVVICSLYQQHTMEETSIYMMMFFNIQRMMYFS